jgi:hypothetical protein
VQRLPQRSARPSAQREPHQQAHAPLAYRAPTWTRRMQSELQKLLREELEEEDEFMLMLTLIEH